MLSTLEGSTLGVWILMVKVNSNYQKQKNEYNIVAKYAYDAYPQIQMVLILIQQ